MSARERAYSIPDLHRLTRFPYLVQQNIEVLLIFVPDIGIRAEKSQAARQSKTPRQQLTLPNPFQHLDIQAFVGHGLHYPTRWK